MSKVMGVAIVCFAVTMAIVIGSRISPESMSIVVGVICGVAVSVPMSALALALAGHKTREESTEPPAQTWNPGSYPRIVLLQGPQGTSSMYPSPPNPGRSSRAIFHEGYPLQELPLPPFQNEPRSFRIVEESPAEYEVEQDTQPSRSAWPG